MAACEVRFLRCVLAIMTKSRVETWVSWSLVALGFLCLPGCRREKPTSVKIGAGPEFKFAGSGRLGSFTVSGPLAGQKIGFPCNRTLFPCSGVATPMWQIGPSTNYLDGVPVEGLQLKYGVVPNAYTQLAPSQTGPAPTLSPGFIYAFSAETTNAPGENGYFYVDGSGAVKRVDVTDLCVTLENGHEIRVNCSTKGPYQEPSDVEEFAREHRRD